MVAASAGLAFIAGAAVWWNAWLAWQQSGSSDPQLEAPSVFALVWASLLLTGAAVALLRGISAILIVGWLLCLSHTVYWATRYFSRSWWASSGISSPGIESMVIFAAVYLALPALGALLPLPDWLQRRREKTKTNAGVAE
ncbi:MAG TPA: hypothetical protein VFV07_03550 [Rhizomicrobium sp.]|nr:hypothetical protein [Rhizomicrobium sp.]